MTLSKSSGLFHPCASSGMLTVTGPRTSFSPMRTSRSWLTSASQSGMTSNRRRLSTATCRMALQRCVFHLPKITSLPDYMRISRRLSTSIPHSFELHSTSLPSVRGDYLTTPASRTSGPSVSPFSRSWSVGHHSSTPTVSSSQPRRTWRSTGLVRSAASGSEHGRCPRA